jgi:LysR family transcriptional regulator, hca operon transcriptional activator
MNGVSLDLRAVHVVVTLAEELHFRRAAEKLYMSQPALTASLKTLERNLGVQLFNRSSRRVELTPAGRIFVDEARSLRSQAQRMLTLVRGTAEGSHGSLRIAYSPAMNIGWLCSLIARTRRELPISVEFVGIESVSVPDLLLNGEIDLALVLGHFRHPELRSVPVLRERLVLALPCGDPLAGWRSVSFGQLEGKPMTWLRRDLNPAAYSDFRELCANHEYIPRIEQEVTTFTEGLQFTSEALGITFIPSSMCLGHENANIVFAEINAEFFDIGCCLVYRVGAHPAILNDFVQVARNHALAGALAQHKL